MKYLLLMLLFFSSMFASIGKVSAVVGDAKIERGNKNIVVKIGIPLFEKDIIRTKKNAKVQLIFKDNTIVTIGKNSALDINTYLYDKKNPKNSKTDLNFFKGAFKTITGKIGKINREKFKLRTKSASIGIRGTIILGNQTVIACTQGGISVESAGITVDVNANELTKVEENKAPSKAENITNNDLNNLEKSLEPASDTTTKDDETNSNEEDNNSESNNDENSDEKTSEESSDSNSNDDTSDEEDDVSSNTLETDVALNPDVDSAEEEAAKIAAQKQAEELAVYTKKTEEVKKATETINTLKTEVTKTQIETQTVLKNLPSTDAVTTYQTNATQTLATANTEVTTAVNNLKDELGSTSSTQSVQSVQSFFSFSFFSTNSVSAQSSSSIETQSNETSLEKAVELRADAQTKYDEINSFRNSQNIDTNSLALASAKTKVDSAKASLDESLIQLNIANQALSDANSAGISSSYISDIQKNVDEVQAAYDSVNEAYTIANDLYENKVQALKDIETSFKKASNGLDKAKLNVEVIKIKDSLEIIKSSQKNAITYKDEVTTSNNKITSGINTLSSQSQTSTLKTNTYNAKTTTDSSINTAVSQLQSSTTNVVTDDALASIINLFNQTSGNTDLLNESTALKSDIVTSDNLAALNIAKAELKKATTALDNSEKEYNNALKNKKDLRTAFDSVIELENNIKKAKELETDDDLAKELGLNSEVSNLKTSSINKADSDFNEAQTAYNEAQTAHASAQALYNDKNNAYNEANASYTNAQEAVNDALVLGKLKDLLVKVDESSDSKTNASTNKDTVLSSKTSIENGINSLISQSQTSTLKTNTDNAKTTTDSSINTAVSQLQSSTTNVITDDALANIVSLFNQTSGNTDLLNQSTTLKNSAVTSDNLAALTSAKTALASASTALENTEAQFQKAQNAYTKIQDLFKTNGTYSGTISEDLKTSLLSKALSDLNSAQSAHVEAQTAQASAEALYNDKQNAYDEANDSYTNAQEAVNDALVLGKLKDLLVKVDESSDSKTNATTNKNTVLNSKTSIENGINSLISQSQTSTLKTNTDNAKTTTDSSINTAVSQLQSSTTNEITDDALANIVSLFNQTSGNTALLNESTALKNDVVTSENLNALNSAKTVLDSANVAVTNTQVQYQNAQSAYNEIQSLFTSNGTYDGAISEELKTSLLSKAQNDLSEAQTAYTQAQSAYTSAQALYDDKQNAYDEANASYTNAQEAVNDALVLQKLVDLIKFMDSGNDNRSTAVLEKTNTLNYQAEITTIIDTLPTDEVLVNKNTNAESTFSTTSTSVNDAIAILENASETSSVNPSEISSLNNSASTTLTNNETFLADAQSFKNSVDNEYKNSLDNATVKLNSAKTHKDNAQQALSNAQQALVDLNNSFESNADNYNSNISDTLKASLISKLNSDISQAQSAFDEADTAYNLVENEIGTKRETLSLSADFSLLKAQEAVLLAKDLAKLSDMLGYIDTANKGSASATASKSNAISAKVVVLAKISTLPTSSEIELEINTANSALTSTQTSVVSAISAITSASNSETVNADDVGNISMSANNLKSSNTTVLENAQVFNTKVTEGEYKTILDEASVKVTEALSAKNSAESAKNSAELAMNNMNDILILFGAEIENEVVLSNGGNFPPSDGESDGESNESTPDSASIVLDSDLISALKVKLKSEYDNAKAAYDEADQAYDLAKLDYDNKNIALNNAATNSLSDAQTAVNETNLLEDLSDLLTSLENTKEAKINVFAEKDKVVDAKNQTISANTNATSANSNIIAFKSDAADAKTASLDASSDSTSASLIANNEETKNVQIAYSAKIAIDKIALSKNKADQASAAAANASSQYDYLVSFTSTMISELAKSLTAKDKAYTNYQTALSQLAIAKAKKIEIDSVSNSEASTSAVIAVAKAQSLHDLALQSYNDANQLYTDTKKIVDDLNITTYLANAETKKNEANSDATAAQAAYNTALLEAIKADTSSKQASLRVKNIMLALNAKQVASDTTASALGLDNKLFELSGVKTNEILIPTAIGTYLGHTQIGVFKEEINSLNPLYLVQADNLQEYFVGYSDSSNSDKTLFTYGVDTNNNFDASKINVYKNFKTLKVNIDGTKVLSNSSTLAYYNPVTKSFTTFSKNVFKEGAKYFTAGDAETFNTQVNTFNFNSSFTISGVDVTESNGDSKFLGSVEQGLTQTSINNNIYEAHLEGETYENSLKESDEISASFLDSQIDVEPLEASRAMSGRAVLMTHSGSAGTSRHENIEMTISNNSSNVVHIVADTKYDNGNTIKRYGGYVNDQKAYYINSDIFGVKVEEPVPGEKGFLIAVPDGGYNQANEFVMYDENDNPLTSNDDSSWGYWGGKNSFDDGNGIVSINPLSTWVAGVKTSTSYMDSLINGASQSLEFNGKVLGTIGYRDSILMDSTNKVQINFDIGGGSKNMTGNMQFKSATSNLYNVDLAINSENINNSSFTGGFKPAGNPGAATTGYINGEYYGGSKLKSIGGNFQVEQHGATANGVFKATKK